MDAATAPHSWLRIVLSTLVLAAAAAVLHAMPPPAPRYLLVDEAVAAADELDGAHLRVHGWVRAGSIVRVMPELSTFVMERSGAALRIWHAGPLPDSLRDQSEVVARGTLHDDWFASEQLSAKCPTKYEGDPRRDLTTAYK